MSLAITTPSREACAAPASRASWCGQLQLGTLGVPVKAYPAIATPPEIPLHQLHAGCGQRIEYRKCCPEHGEVPPEEIIKGYPYQADRYIELAETELAQFQPTDDKTIRLDHFLDPGQVDLVLLAGRSLYLSPAHPAACRPFALIHRALLQSGKWAIGRVIFSSKWQIVTVRPSDQVLVVHTLYHPAQRRALVHDGNAELEISPQELRPLVRSIEATNREVPWAEYQDDTERRLTELVEAKVTAAAKPRASRSNGSSRGRRKAA